MGKKPTRSKDGQQSGGVMILVAVSMVALLGFAALAVDVGHLMVARNELQNAADAGALAGAAVLYNDNGTVINTGTNQVAFDAARANHSEKVPVDVNWTSGTNGPEVQRGHWSFGLTHEGVTSSRGFYPNDSTAVIALPGLEDEELDTYDGQGGRPVFVNAVRVVARRQAVSGTPILSFFARIFGHENFELGAEAVAYRGFAGKLLPGDVDLPIAICEEYAPEGDCSIGRFINSSDDPGSSDTGAWTDFAQEENTGTDPCSGGTNSNDVKDLVACDGEVNELVIYGGEDIATNNGDIQSAFNILINTWKSCASNPEYDGSGNETGERTPIDTDVPPDGIPDEPWCVTLPRIDCCDNPNDPTDCGIQTCKKVTGAIKICIVWISAAGEDPSFDNAPDHMADWPTDEERAAIPDFDTNGQARWNSFVEHFSLQNVDGSNAPYTKKSIYFKPDCTPEDLAGVTGGQNYGVLAKIPVLVD